MVVAGAAPERRMAQPPRLGALPPIRALQTRAGRLTYIVSGKGSPAILLFNGAGVSLQGWRPLYPEIEQLGTVFGWNRFGMQGSDAPGERQTGAVVLARCASCSATPACSRPTCWSRIRWAACTPTCSRACIRRRWRACCSWRRRIPEDQQRCRGTRTQLVRSLGKLLELPEAVPARQRAKRNWPARRRPRARSHRPADFRRCRCAC